MWWLTLAAMTAVAVLFAIVPLFFRRRARKDERSDIAFYSAQLGEIDRDVERGLLPPDEASTARAETARRLLAANSTVEASPASAPSGSSRSAAGALISAAILIVGGGVYGHFGSPALADEPLAARQDAAPEPDPVEAAVTHIEAELAVSQDNEKAWAALAPVYLRLGRYNDAVNANRQLLRLKGEDGALRANLGEAEVAAAGGKVTPEAHAEFEKALAESPGLVVARFYLALELEQAGETQKAIEAYVPLVEDSKDHPRWVQIIQGRLAALKGAKAPAAPAGAQTSAPTGVPDSQKAMVEFMVNKLAMRLAESGGSVDDWLRLVRSYGVMNDSGRALEALASARKALSADASAGPKLDALAKELGLDKAPEPAPAAAAPSPAPAASSPAPGAPSPAAAGAVPDSQQDMVQAMVSRLAKRLAEKGGSAEDWNRLIRSYSVLHETDKAKAALASARKALVADAAGLASVDAEARELNVEP